MNETLRKYKKYLENEQQRSSHTVRSYMSSAEKIVDTLDKDPLKLTNTDLEKFRDRLVKEDIMNKTKNIHLYAVKSLVNFLNQKKLNEKLTKDPLYSFGHNGESSHIEIPDEEDLKSFLDYDEGKRNNIIVELLYKTGLRAAELLSLKTGQVKKSFNIIGKGNKQRVICCSKDTVDKVRKYEKKNKKGDKLFTISQRQLNEIFLVRSGWVGIKITPHILRHCYATKLLSCGVGLRELQDLLGHASLLTTQRYAHVRSARLQDAYNSVW